MAATKKSESDKNFPGRGVLLCKICGLPCVKHRIGRCPFADDAALFYGPAGNIKRTRAELKLAREEADEWTNSTPEPPS